MHHIGYIIIYLLPFFTTCTTLKYHCMLFKTNLHAIKDMYNLRHNMSTNANQTLRNKVKVS